MSEKMNGYVIGPATHGLEITLDGAHVAWAGSMGEAKRLIEARIDRLKTRAAFAPDERKRAGLAELRAAGAARRPR